MFICTCLGLLGGYIGMICRRVLSGFWFLFLRDRMLWGSVLLHRTIYWSVFILVRIKMNEGDLRIIDHRYPIPWSFHKNRRVTQDLDRWCCFVGCMKCIETYKYYTVYGLFINKLFYYLKFPHSFLIFFIGFYFIITRSDIERYRLSLV